MKVKATNGAGGLWFGAEERRNGEEKKKKTRGEGRRKGGYHVRPIFNWQISALVPKISWPQFFFFYIYIINLSHIN